jgi:hypothetical protein
MQKRFQQFICFLGSLSLLCVLCSPGVAKAQSMQDELKMLKEAVGAMQKTIKEQNKKIEEQNKKIDELEKAQAKEPVKVAEAPPSGKKPVGTASPVTYRDSMDDKQTAAPRLDDLTMHPKYKGFIPIPNTPGMIRFNARPRVDITYDDGNPGDPDRFVTAKIPVKGDSNYGGDNEFNINSKASHLSFEVVAPEVDGTPRFFYENDFFGSGSNKYEYRIKHLYGEWHNFIVGHTFSVFEDPDIWPDTVDFEGPNSMVFARWPLVHYMYAINNEWTLKFGIEEPDSWVSDYYGGGAVTDVEGVNSAPDGGFNVRWARAGVGHVQFGTILRYLGAKNDTFNFDDNTFGWGTNLSGGFDVFRNDTVLAQLTYGEGIGRYGNDTSFFDTDAAFDADGDLQALEYFGGFFGYTHRWSDEWRSTATHGYVSLDNEPSQGPDAYDTTHYASLNLIWQLREKLSIGFECLYGKNEVQSGADGDLFRVQTGILYRLF